MNRIPFRPRRGRPRPGKSARSRPGNPGRPALSAVFSLFMVLAAGWAGCSRLQSLQSYSFTEEHMGTDFNILLYAADSTHASHAARAAFDRVEELDQILSTYKEGSELNRLSETAGSGDMMPLSESLFFIVCKAVQISGMTGGVFDMTTGPYIELWRIARRTGRTVPAEELQAAGRRVGYDYIETDGKTRSVRLQQEGMVLDSGGIGKGYAVDEALSVLRGFGIESALVDGGGDISAADPPPGREGWEIGFSAADGGELIQARLMIANQSVATSGDYYQFTDTGGVRYSHIIDPRTGLGVTGRNTVTLLAPDGLHADAFATAVTIMGPAAAEQWISLIPDAEFQFVRKKDGIFESRTTPGFDRHVISN
ncbi:MAG: FAD:protein FMN transferase [Balneolaceae bacterium]